MEQKDLISTDFSIDDMIVSHLKESGKWAKFLGITGFIFSCLFALVAVFGDNTSAALSLGVYGLAYLVTVVYLLLAIVSFVFSLFVYRFGVHIKVALENNNQEKLISAFGNLKLFFRMSGIITILYIVLILFIFLGLIITLASR